MKTKDTVSILATVVIAGAYVWLVYRTDRWNKFQYQDFSTKIANIAESKRVPVREYPDDFPDENAEKRIFEDEVPASPFKLNIKGIGDPE